MEHDDVAELLGAYALDALDDDVERIGVVRHLRVCVKCRGELDDHLTVAAALAGGGGDAPADVWPTIAASLGSEPPPPLHLVVDRSVDRPVDR